MDPLKTQVGKLASIVQRTLQKDMLANTQSSKIAKPEAHETRTNSMCKLKVKHHYADRFA